MGKISRSSKVRAIASSPRVSSSRASRRAGVVQAADGESTRIRVLDYLGGGKLVIALKGERVVANTALYLEKNQEIDVTVKNIGDKIILQLMSGDQHSISVESAPAMKPFLGDVIRHLMASLEDAQTEMSLKSDDTLKGLIKDIRELVQRIPVDVTEKDLPQQIRDAVKAMGHDYERKLADAFVRGRFSVDEIGLQLKAKLMRLHSILSEEPFRTALLESVENMLENMESQQLRSTLQADRFQHFFTQFPFFMQGQLATAGLEFFRPKAGGKLDDDNYSIALSFDLQRLGHIEFAINVADKHINCRIKADKYEIYELAKEQVGLLEGRLTALGYSVGGIHCIVEDPENRTTQEQNQIVMDEIDITV